MESVRELMGKMFNNLEEQKRSINQFSLTAHHTITEMYRADAFVEQIKSGVKRLNELLALYEKLVNTIALQSEYLKATSEAMDKNLREMNATENLQYSIRGDLSDLKKEVNRVIDRAEEILRV